MRSSVGSVIRKNFATRRQGSEHCSPELAAQIDKWFGFWGEGNRVGDPPCLGPHNRSRVTQEGNQHMLNPIGLSGKMFKQMYSWGPQDL